MQAARGDSKIHRHEGKREPKRVREQGEIRGWEVGRDLSRAMKTVGEEANEGLATLGDLLEKHCVLRWREWDDEERRKGEGKQNA